MPQHLRVLVLEDSAADAELLLHHLRAAGFDCEWERVDDEASFTAALRPDLDLILADYTLPQFDALRALALVKGRRLAVPFIVVTGASGEENAVECLHEGATDYLLKDRLARLPEAVKRGIERKQAERDARLAAEVLERVAALVLVADERGAIVYASPSVERLLGYRREEVLGDGWWQLSRRQQTDGTAERRRIAASASDTRAVDTAPYEQKIVGRDGREHWYVWQDGQGPGRTIVGVGHVVTERKRAEEERQRLVRDLGERVKEAQLLHHVARLLQSLTRPLPDLIREIVTAMPGAWQFPEAAIARIHLAGVDACSAPDQSAAVVQREHVGRNGDYVEVGYRQPLPFLAEEQAVLTSLAEMLNAHIEHRESALALAASEAKYRALVEQVPVVAYAAPLDPAQPPIYLSPQIERLIGVSVATFIETPAIWLRHIHPGDRTQAVEHANQIRERGGSNRIEYRMLHADGHVVWVRDEAVLVNDAAGAPVCVQGVMFDITDRKQAEDALKESNRKMETLIAASPVAILEVDADGTVTRWSPAAERLFGWSASEVIGGPNPIVPPEYVSQYRQCLERNRDGEYCAYETRRRRKDGTLVDVLISAAPLRSADEGWPRSVALIADISDRVNAETLLREREAHFRSIIENAQDVVATVSAQGVITYVSPSVERVTGKRPDEVVGTAWSEWLNAEDVQAVTELLQAIKEQGGQAESFTAGVRHADGTWRLLEMVTRLNPRKDGELEFIVGGRDVTERQALEEQLRQAQKMEAIGQLAGGVAHDFNNLLTVILGHGEWVRSELPDSSELTANVDEIVHASQRAAALTRQLLAFSRKQVLRPRSVNLNTVVTDVEKMLRRVLGENIELDVRLAHALSDVTADVGQLEQVLLNLAVNARDAMPSGGTLTMTTTDLDIPEPFADGAAVIQPGRWVCLSVADTGTGMPPEVAARVFDPFYTTKPVGQGTGLGLSTVYGVVAQSRGQIGLDTVVGRGTTFRIYLPQGSVVARDESHARKAAAAGGSETILLVEDEPGIRSLIRKALERHGYRVLEAADGDAAMQIARENSGTIDMLLSDIVMPGISGVELAQRLVTSRPALKVLHISGYPIGAHVGKSNPKIAFLQKPFTPATLVQQVRDCLDRHKPDREDVRV